MIGTGGNSILDDPAAWADMFRQTRALACGGILDHAFLAMLMKYTAAAAFMPDPMRDRGQRLREHPGIAGKALTLALSARSVLAWLEEVTGRGPLTRAQGAVLQMEPDVDSLHWHDDLQTDASRVLGVTVNLSPEPFVGGDFTLRCKAGGETLVRHKHVAIGSALIFDVAASLEHRVSPVTAGGPRRIFTGWFLR